MSVNWLCARRVPIAQVVGCAVLIGCTPADQVPLGPTIETDPAVPAMVTRGDIVSVLTVDGTVVATPELVVLAEEGGRVVWHTQLEPEDPVLAGEVVAWEGEAQRAAPVAGFLAEWLVPDGVVVHKGVPIVALRYAGFGVAAAVPPAEAYRLYDGATSARAQVTGGPGPTECEPLPVRGTGAAGSATEGMGEPKIEVLCALPEDIPAIAGSPAQLGLTTGERHDVLLLPAQAVAGAAGRGTVAKLVGGELVLVDVTLGITDGVDVEIIDGLAEGDEVWPYGPNLLPKVQ